ncbi:hypothetical protein N7462_002464 [Penicillium macrosclerotiorum]|uniref:uncharacterized protein n=1 Tax=Penicillium macrosclerotiorum TaxID=303699 RepID=UPI0025485659|nr:uncharacterized protein N7462_002464 [Penicillium macrosclerotiorum]KAJ5693041.1 hypothetical protein N7462_002464 [Penicillium macrosclerotiorum]
MSTVPHSSADPPQAPPTSSKKPQRTLACVLCQQRKVRCDRKLPCANCVKHQVHCVPSTQTRPRRRRFPERQLLDRLRNYEDLLRQNKVKFEPLHRNLGPVSDGKGSPEGFYDSGEELPEARETDTPSPLTPSNSKNIYEAKNIWHAMSQGFRGVNNDGDLNDGVREVMAGKTWDNLFENDDHVLFGSRAAAVDLSTFHPEPVHIFRLWQIYLDNVNPLLKVTHTPTLQGRIIEAASNTTQISPNLEALMFGIYCMAILSMTDGTEAVFGLPKVELLRKYQFGCQQALLNCRFLRSSDPDCLTALYLYLISVHPITDPRSLSSMLGIAIRIAQRMGIHYESTNRKYPVLESEMRRRLWWSLVLFDARISELSDYKTTTLAPTWDCALPLNVNDSDLRAEMKEPPAVQGRITESLFTVLRNEMGDFVRHSSFHLDFTNPALKSIAKELPEGGDLIFLEKTVEEKYFDLCDLENPLHFMTVWMTRSSLSKCCLLEYYSRQCAEPQVGTSQDTPMLYAFRILESDTKLMTSPLTKGFLWSRHFHFPLPAYIHIVQELIKQSVNAQAKQAWEVMSDNYEARFTAANFVGNSIFKTFTKIILQAWEAFEASCKDSGEIFAPPRIVLSLRERAEEMAQKEQYADAGQQPSDLIHPDINDLLQSLPMGFSNPNPVFNTGRNDNSQGVDPSMIPLGGPSSTADMNHLAWASMAWGFGERRPW